MVARIVLGNFRDEMKFSHPQEARYEPLLSQLLSALYGPETSAVYNGSVSRTSGRAWVLFESPDGKFAVEVSDSASISLAVTLAQRLGHQHGFQIGEPDENCAELPLHQFLVLDQNKEMIAEINVIFFAKTEDQVITQGRLGFSFRRTSYLLGVRFA
ncbi:MAG: hypothetical protein KDD62_04430, partial [Bdellovibrionales bacterium]|nr:hypothetical protein [Bdellovibrionales bacterium]